MEAYILLSNPTTACPSSPLPEGGACASTELITPQTQTTTCGCFGPEADVVPVGGQRWTRRSESLLTDPTPKVPWVGAAIIGQQQAAEGETNVSNVSGT